MCRVRIPNSIKYILNLRPRIIHTDLSNLVNVTGHNADLASIGGNNTGAVGSNQASLILSLHSTDNLHPMSHHRFVLKQNMKTHE